MLLFIPLPPSPPLSPYRSTLPLSFLVQLPSFLRRSARSAIGGFTASLSRSCGLVRLCGRFGIVSLQGGAILFFATKPFGYFRHAETLYKKNNSMPSVVRRWATCCFATLRRKATPYGRGHRLSQNVLHGTLQAPFSTLGHSVIFHYI